MEEQETIADIIAEMRDGGHTGESSCLEWIRAKMRYYADRLEAAWKREKSEIEADALAVGGMVEASRKRELSKNTSKNRVDFEQLVDCAKMREALQQAKVAILAARKKMGVDNPIILEIIDAALAAPPRNCDRFATFNDAIIALADKRGWHDGKWNSERYCILAQWLFATAKPETEGGSDGNK